VLPHALPAHRLPYAARPLHAQQPLALDRGQRRAREDRQRHHRDAIVDRPADALDRGRVRGAAGGAGQGLAGFGYEPARSANPQAECCQVSEPPAEINRTPRDSDHLDRHQADRETSQERVVALSLLEILGVDVNRPGTPMCSNMTTTHASETTPILKIRGSSLGSARPRS
jgi:hypothetical protein